MNLGRYMCTDDGRHWVCIEDCIKSYREEGTESGDRVALYFEAMLALALEWRPAEADDGREPAPSPA